MAEPRRLIEPPLQALPLDATSGGQFSHTWTRYNQSVADGLNSVLDLAASKYGVTDGSDAPAGQVGEYLTASGSVGLANNGVATVATLSLTAGDWDVTGGVTFSIAGAASSHYAVGLDGAMSVEIVATIPTGSGTWRLAIEPARRNSAAAVTVALSALASFSSGAVTASGVIHARRAR